MPNKTVRANAITCEICAPERAYLINILLCAAYTHTHNPMQEYFDPAYYTAVLEVSLATFLVPIVHPLLAAFGFCTAKA